MLISSQHRLSNTKKADIRFIRNVAAPKQQLPVKSYSTSNIACYPSSLIIPSNTPSHAFTLNLAILSVDNTVHKYYYQYGYETKVGQLVQFIKNKMQLEFVYFKTGNFLIDYFLTLQYKLLSQLGLTQLELVVKKISSSQIKQINLKSMEIIKCIGSGGFSKVLLARVLGLIMAIKIIDKQFIFKTAKQTIVENQKLILQQCSGHPFITKLYFTFQSKNYIVLGMEYCPGGELFNLLRRVKKMKENDAKFYFIETLLAIQHLHNKGILYRDLKPENIIIDAQGHVRLADFGLSKIIGRNATYSFCGSAEYMSPEMLLKKGHSYEVDYYCLGALLYELVTGLPPFYTQNQGQLFHNILNSSVTFPSHAILSASLKSFLIKILQKQPQNRFQSITDILQDPWVAQNFNRQEVLNKKLIPPYPTAILSYNFDDSQFAMQEQTIFRMLQNEADARDSDRQFNGFYYQSDQIITLKSDIEQSSKVNYNFMKNKSVSKKQIHSHSRNNSIHSQNYNPLLTQSSKNLNIKQLLTRHHDSSIIQAMATPLSYSLSKHINSNNNTKTYESPRQAVHPSLSLSSPKSGLSSPNVHTIYTNKPRFLPSPVLKTSPKPMHNIYSRYSQKSISKQKQRDFNASSSKLQNYMYRNHMVHALYGRNSSKDHGKAKDKSSSLDRSYNYKQQSYSNSNLAKTRKTIQLNYFGKYSSNINNDSKLNSINSLNNSHTSNNNSTHLSSSNNSNSNKVKKGLIKNNTDKINFQHPGGLRNVYSHNINHGK